MHGSELLPHHAHHGLKKEEKSFRFCFKLEFVVASLNKIEVMMNLKRRNENGLDVFYDCPKMLFDTDHFLSCQTFLIDCLFLLNALEGWMVVCVSHVFFGLFEQGNLYTGGRGC